MSQLNFLIQRVAETIADYRADCLQQPTIDRVRRWIYQFDKTVRIRVLAEVSHILKKSYLSKNRFISILDKLALSKVLGGNDPVSFWKSVHLLEIQNRGSSQRDILRIFRRVAESRLSVDFGNRRSSTNTFVYIDDAIYQGHRIIDDLGSWIESSAPSQATLIVIVVAWHEHGKRYAEGRLKRISRDAGKTIAIRWYTVLKFEDRIANINDSDVLRPSTIPNDPSVRDYVHSLNYQPVLRIPGGTGRMNLFSSNTNREIVEQEFLKKGIEIRSMCPYLNDYQRPLGNMILESCGFGALFVTFRNCPNNAPLVFWVGDPWYPLFPREIN